VHTLKMSSFSNHEAANGGVIMETAYTKPAKIALDGLGSVNRPNPVKTGMHRLNYGGEHGGHKQSRSGRGREEHDDPWSAPTATVLRTCTRRRHCRIHYMSAHVEQSLAGALLINL
jgi:hypothetical protein